MKAVERSRRAWNGRAVRNLTIGIAMSLCFGGCGNKSTQPQPEHPAAAPPAAPAPPDAAVAVVTPDAAPVAVVPPPPPPPPPPDSSHANGYTTAPIALPGA